MITGELRNEIDRLWTKFWTGGITNPLTVIEQITFLMFSRMLDIREVNREKSAKRTGDQTKGIFGPNEQHLRWSHFLNLGKGDEMLKLVRDEVFPHFKKAVLNGNKTSLSEFMADAQLMINKPSLLIEAVEMINKLPLEKGDTKGDLYEYLLSKLTTAGINGQFRTPRHIIELMVSMLDIKPTETVADPACGTSGFLVGTKLFLNRQYTSPELVRTDESGEKVYDGDLLKPYEEHINNNMFHGFDFDVTMLRIAAMNLLLHNVTSPDIHYQDTLSNSFPEKFPNSSQDAFDVVLANPPFKGSLDDEDVHRSLLAIVKTRKTELLFIALILRMLKLGGRSATIVPQGVLFGSSKAHVDLRKTLIEENQLEAVISLPSGVFKPYAGVATAIILFTKGGKTDQVWFYDVQADGYSLDDKRDKIDDNDLPDCLEQWQQRDPATANSKKNDRTQKHFWVPSDEIRKNKYDLSLNRYKKEVYQEEEYEAPKVILGKLKTLESEIQKELEELEGMLV
ncbi:type I restriction-modification system subunit M [bacterium]|nr:type I restriction-modification system subunit M [bacterium]